MAGAGWQLCHASVHSCGVTRAAMCQTVQLAAKPKAKKGATKKGAKGKKAKKGKESKPPTSGVSSRANLLAWQAWCWL